MATDLPPALRDLYTRYEKDYIPTMKTPKDRLYLEMHEGHLIYMRPGEEQFVTESLVQGFSLTGSGEEISARLATEPEKQWLGCGSALGAD